MKYKIRLVTAIAVLGGILSAAGYVNPYDGIISLSELVLQLSGSRGEIPLGVSMTDLLSLFMRMLPNYIFEVYFGTVLYRHFCTASIYVFSRCPNRLRWYFREALTLGTIVCLYQFLLLSTIVIITVLRYRLTFDKLGIVLLLYHFLLYTVWVYSITLSINLLAIGHGSSLGFAVAMGLQTICITLLSCVKIIEEYMDTAFLEIFLKLNPIAHLILGWHRSNISGSEKVLNSPYPGLNLNSSLCLCLVIFSVTFLTGAVIIKKHDLLVSNQEEG